MARKKSLPSRWIQPATPGDSELGFNESAQNPNSNRSLDNSDWGYCTEDELEEIFMKKLEVLYNLAVDKLVELGYGKKVAISIILTNGHCCGGGDALSNIFNNSLRGNLGDHMRVFANLKQLQQFSLFSLVRLLQRSKPHLTKGDAMWCLLMSNLDVGRANRMKFDDALNSDCFGHIKSESSGSATNTEKIQSDSGVTPGSCRLYGGWGFGKKKGRADFPVNRSLSHGASKVTLQKETEFPNWSNLSPSMKMLLKSNVAAFAAEYRVNLERRQVLAQEGSSSLSNGDLSNAVETGGEDHPSKQTEFAKNQEGFNMMLKKFHDLNLNLDGDMEFVPEDQRDEIILSLVHQIKDLERQVKEKKEWAHQKAMQAARKLSHDLTELKMLRMEREENRRLKQLKPTVDDSIMKRLSEMESALMEASGQVDRANIAVRLLEMENAEIRAEVEASKLSASESVTKCLEAARREKKYLKKLLAWEKQRAKLQEDIMAEKQKMAELQEEMLQVEATKQTVEAKRRHEQKAKDAGIAEIEEEKRLKEATKATNKQNHEALLSKIELDLQRHKDDLQRLQQELSLLKSSTDPQPQLDDSDENEIGIDRGCIICSKCEASVVFLPCAHQLLCGSCNDEYVKKGVPKCPICWARIEQRIHVFGSTL